MSGRFMPADDGGAWRDWFHRLLHAREDAAVLSAARDWLRTVLDAVDLAGTPASLEDLPTIAVAAAAELAATPAQIACHAPLGLLEGAWLQSLALAQNSAQPAVADLFAAYLALLGADEADSPAFAYRGWLHRHGLAFSPVAAWQFAQDPRIGSLALRHACVQLALGLAAADHVEEALGYTLAYAHSASPWRLPAIAEPRRSAVLQAIAAQGAQAAKNLASAGGDWRRLRLGYALYLALEAECLPALRRVGAAETTLAGQVAALFRSKLRFARGYHSQVRLAGRGLEDWLADQPFDAAAFLQAFAASPFAQGASGQRPFDRLTAFGGPMFGVFDRAEMALLTVWLDGLAQPPGQPPVAAAIPLLAQEAEPGRSTLPPPPAVGGASPAAVAPFGKPSQHRELFHRLLQTSPDAEALSAARRRVEQVLRAANRLGPPGFAYSPDAFARHIEQIQQRETAKRPAAPLRFSREECIWAIRQFAPAVLVDGGWLQHQGAAAGQDSRLRRLLYRIYAEELGEGHTSWNHPHIYRDLLDGLGIDLPQTHTPAFAAHPEFLDAAFDLPSYLLAIAQFPNTYLAETLGLNWAIEQSGLGAGYLRLAEAFRHCGIDAQIISLHLSIDNLAGGHAAMAAEAIQLYLADARTMGGDNAVAAAWWRIWCGYRSLDAATRRFKWALAWAFCRRFAPARLYALLAR